MPPLTQRPTPAPTNLVGIGDALRLSLSFAPDTRRVAYARRVAGALLREREFAEDTVQTVELLVSEIVTNAVVHGRGGRVRFLFAYDGAGDVRIEVDDQSRACVKVRPPNAEDETGRGMFLVAALARQWGRRGTRTWCTVATEGASSP
ncbi:ATP-binding protein [Streptomyces sp. NBC_01317]|uniref:ATP-binding protein n=1 Tax=Streptomyces sp. NBC_01317 TaxID=2903822 RepID=UPI002E0FC2F9|nr:ATP-binding protein [Streptomyces sp. NBC_01317]